VGIEAIFQIILFVQAIKSKEFSMLGNLSCLLTIDLKIINKVAVNKPLSEEERQNVFKSFEITILNMFNRLQQSSLIREHKLEFYDIYKYLIWILSKMDFYFQSLF